jgi:hypothetical protein
LAGEVVALLSTLRAEHGAALGFEHIRSGFLAVDENGTPLRPERWSDMGRTPMRDMVTTIRRRSQEVTY